MGDRLDDLATRIAHLETEVAVQAVASKFAASERERLEDRIDAVENRLAAERKESRAGNRLLLVAVVGAIATVLAALIGAAAVILG